MNVLKPWLADNLPEDWVLGDGEMITEAFVIVRIVDASSEEEHLPERLEYTTSRGLSFTMARGMIDCIQDDLVEINVGAAAIRSEGDDEVGP